MKPWYASKTLWINLVAIIALAAQTLNSSYVISPEIQGAVLAIINLILRVVTNQPLDWNNASGAGNETPPGPPATAGFVLLRLLPLLPLAALLMLAAGCATTGTGVASEKDSPLILAGKSLLAVKGTIVAAATATDALCKAGKISADKCVQAKAAYETAKPAYDAAIDAYLLMTSMGGDSGDFSRSLTRVQSLATDLLALTGGAR